MLKILRKIYTRDLEMRIVVMSKLILQSCKRWSKSSEEEIEKEVLDIFLTMVNLIFFVRGYDVMTQFNQVFINTIVDDNDAEGMLIIEPDVPDGELQGYRDGRHI